MMWILRDLSICCLQIYMLVDFEKNFLTYRIPSQKSCMIIYAFAIVGIRMINHAGSTVLNMIGIPVCYMVITLFVFRDSIWKKSTLSLCYYMLAIAPEFMFAAATNAYGVHGHTDTFQSELEKTWMILLMKLVTFKTLDSIERKIYRFRTRLILLIECAICIVTGLMHWEMLYFAVQISHFVLACSLIVGKRQ